MVLSPPEWSIEKHHCFPVQHRRAVMQTLLAHNRAGTLLSTVPKDVLLHEILPKVEYNAFTHAMMASDLAALASEAERAERADEQADVDTEDDESEGDYEEENDEVLPMQEETGDASAEEDLEADEAEMGADARMTEATSSSYPSSNQMIEVHGGAAGSPAGLRSRCRLLRCL